MNTRPVSIMTKLWLISILVLALLVWDGAAGADTTSDQRLIGVAALGDVERVRTYLDEGANITAKDQFGRTPLMNGDGAK
jgi:hypothetical protein